MSEPSLPIKAAGWRVIIEPAEVPTTTEGGIELPPDAQASLDYIRHVGQVVDVGPLAYRSDPRFQDSDENGNSKPIHFCKKGDWVVFAKHSGHPLQVLDSDDETRKLKIFNDDEVLAVLDDPSRLITKL